MSPGWPALPGMSVKVTVQFKRCFRLMEHISINLYITEKLIAFSKSLFINFK